MPASNPCNYAEAYAYYLETKDITLVGEKYHKRRSVLKREFLALGYEYPIKRMYKLGYNLNHPPKKYKDLDIDYFKIIDSSDKAYMLGLIYADGNVYIKKDKDSGNRYSFRLTLKGSDKYLLDNFAKAIGINETNCSDIGREKFISITGKTYSSHDMHGVSIHRRDFVLNLEQQGVQPNKTYKGSSIPKTLDTKYIPALLRGYFDGDGCVGVYKNGKNLVTHCYIVSKTDDILKEFCTYLEKRNISCYIRYYNELFLLRIRQKSFLDFWDIIKPNPENVFRMERKINKFEMYRRLLEESKSDNSVNCLGSPEEDNQQPSPTEML